MLEWGAPVDDLTYLDFKQQDYTGAGWRRS
jgi:hypothetical protein